MPKKSGLCEVMGADEGRFDDVITRTVSALENGARHRIPLLWTLGGAFRAEKRSAQASAHPLSQAQGGLFCVLTVFDSLFVCQKVLTKTE